MKTYETSVARLTEHFEARKKVVFIPVLNEEMEKATQSYAKMAEIETGSGLSLIVNQCADMDSTSILLLVINPEREQDIIDFATAIGDKYNVDVKIFSTTKQTINDLIVGKDFQLNNDFFSKPQKRIKRNSVNAVQELYKKVPYTVPNRMGKERLAGSNSNKLEELTLTFPQQKNPHKVNLARLMFVMYAQNTYFSPFWSEA